MKARSRNHCCSGKAIHITYSECVSVCVPQLSHKQIASFLCRIVLSSVAGLAVPYFATLSCNNYDFQKKCVMIFSKNLSENISRIIIIKVRRYSCTVPDQTNLPPSYADCLEIWKPKPPGTVGVCPGLYRDSFTFTCTKCTTSSLFLPLIPFFLSFFLFFLLYLFIYLFSISLCLRLLHIFLPFPFSSCEQFGVARSLL
jgi:hypothetical protein